MTIRKEMAEQIKRLKEENKHLAMAGTAVRSDEALLSLVRRFVKHVGMRNAMQEISKEFCSGCGGRSRKDCPLPDAIKVVG